MHPRESQMPPVTPNHQRIIDEILATTLARIQELAPALGYGPVPSPSENQLLASPLAKELRVLIRYVEGYDLGEGHIDSNITKLARLLFPAPLSAKGYQFPAGFQKTPLGAVIHAAWVRQYPATSRMTAAEVTRALGVTRQTVHGWAADGTLTPIYEQSTLTFLRRQVQALKEQRLRRKNDDKK